jgi:hypothetical protein
LASLTLWITARILYFFPSLNGEGREVPHRFA